MIKRNCVDLKVGVINEMGNNVAISIADNAKGTKSNIFGVVDEQDKKTVGKYITKFVYLIIVTQKSILLALSMPLRYGRYLCGQVCLLLWSKSSFVSHGFINCNCSRTIHSKRNHWKCFKVVL